MYHQIVVVQCPIEWEGECPRFNPGNTFSLDNFAVGLWDRIWPEGMRVQYRNDEWKVQSHTLGYQVLENPSHKYKYGPALATKQNGEPAPHTRLKRMR